MALVRKEGRRDKERSEQGWRGHPGNGDEGCWATTAAMGLRSPEMGCWQSQADGLEKVGEYSGAPAKNPLELPESGGVGCNPQNMGALPPAES